ncbi:MAG: HupE/UreJ family protein [Sphingobacteriales bacterium]|nr:MAG: HupE/UreJ family protein [Sphingobacteriales bacterium]
MILLHERASLAVDSEFRQYFDIGVSHILSATAYDHILFIVALCAFYRPQQWRKLLILVTAFTIGHSVTLALAAFDLIGLPPKLVETAIPVTIALTAANNIYFASRSNELSQQRVFSGKQSINYLTALFFGLVHGMGFAGSFRFLMGEEDSIVKQLLAFNLGVEAGQIVAVVVLMLVLYILLRYLKVSFEKYILVVSGAAAGVAITLVINSLTQ